MIPTVGAIGGSSVFLEAGASVALQRHSSGIV